uniref:Uncharacterized protein n=1 Tax=Ditylenchus dipsaci TaxID=166011 RepID=A0A915DL99_9BILA
MSITATAAASSRRLRGSKMPSVEINISLTRQMALRTTSASLSTDSAELPLIRKAMNSIAYRIHSNEAAGSATDLREAPSGSPPAFCKIKEGFAVRSGHLAPPVATPDSPRPQKNNSSGSDSFATTLTIPPANSSAGAQSKSSTSK